MERRGEEGLSGSQGFGPSTIQEPVQASEETAGGHATLGGLGSFFHFSYSVYFKLGPVLEPAPNRFTLDIYL